MIKYVPNILTFARVVMTIVLLVMILYTPAMREKGDIGTFINIAFIFFVVTGLTDIIDGNIARKYNVTSKLGRIMDPLADKVLVCGSFICFAIIGEPKLFAITGLPLKVIHWGVVAILIARELYVTILRQIAEARGINFAATVSGKLKMFLQSFAIGTVLIKIGHAPDALWAYWFTAVVFVLMISATVVSGIRATTRKSWKELS